MRRSIAITLCFVLVISTFSMSFASTSKDEVIYMNLDSAGNLDKTYVVNVFNSEGSIEDYGKYDNVKNLTDMAKINIDDEKITINTKSEKFYYQGELTNAQMPWDININYYLDGEEVKAEDLVSKNGRVKIKIDIKKNESGNEDIYRNFSLQVSIGADSDKLKEIKSESASIAYAGGKTSLNYIVLPKEEKTIELEFLANDLEMDPIRFVAVPFNMDIEFEIPDVENPMEKVDELKDGVSKLSDASSALSSGASELSSGLSSLNKGSTEFNKGLKELTSNSKQLSESSTQILNGLNQLKMGLESGAGSNSSSIDELIQGSADIDSAITDLLNGLRQYSAAFDQFSSTTDFTELIAGNNQLKAALQQQLSAFDGIPDSALTPEQLATKTLLMSQIELIDRTIVVLNYRDVANENKVMAQTVKGIILGLEQQLQTPGLPQNVIDDINARIVALNQQVQIFESNEEAILARDTFIDTMQSNLAPLIAGLETLSVNYKQFDAGINQIPSEMQESLEGINTLKSEVGTLVDGYTQFNSGLNEFIEGQKTLSANYNNIDTGIFGSMSGAGDLSGGASRMASGMNELNGGLSEFNIKEFDSKINELKDKYKFEDYKIKSFVSDKNTNVKIQQFIIATPAIEKEVVKKVKDDKNEDLSLWQKIKKVFGY